MLQIKVFLVPKLRTDCCQRTKAETQDEAIHHQRKEARGHLSPKSHGPPYPGVGAIPVKISFVLLLIAAPLIWTINFLINKFASDFDVDNDADQLWKDIRNKRIEKLKIEVQELERSKKYHFERGERQRRTTMG